MNIIFMIIILIISSAVTYAFLYEIKSCSKETNKVKLHRIEKFARIFIWIPIAAAFLDGFHIINFGSCSKVFVFIGTVPIIAYLLNILNRQKHIKTIAFAVKLMLIASILEVTLFNLPSYRLCFGNFCTVTADASLFERNENTKYRDNFKDVIVTNGAEATLTINNLNEQVGNVFINMSFNKTNAKKAYVYIDAMDETQTSDYRFSIAEGYIVKNRSSSQYIPLYLSGNVGSIRIRIKAEGEGTFYVKNVILNTNAPITISWLRFLLIVLVGSLLYAVMKERRLQKSLGECKIVGVSSAVIITAVAVILALGATKYKLGDTKIKDLLKQKTGNQMSQELVEAFEKHSTSLLDNPSQSLLDFDNPYDRAYRESSGIDAKWDHVYYNGKYYSYYGIAPVILLFLPYHLITGYFLADAVAILIFAAIGIIGLTFAFTQFVKKLFPKLPCGIYIISLIILQMVSGIWFSIGRPSFYETAISAGFAFLTWAVYFLLSANIFGKGKISFAKTAAASLLFAAAVLSRPTLVLYCICAAIFMIAAMPKTCVKTADGKQKLFCRSSVSYLCCAIVPMACLGLIQMWYNFNRFGSPFEFGIQYSLTVNNFTKAQFHPQLSLIALYNYLFNPPVISPVYPIVSTKFSQLGVGGFFYSDVVCTGNTSGLFFLALPMFAYFVSGRALKTISDKKTRIRSAIFTALPCIVVPFIIIASVWESGYAVRYMADFSWQSLLGAYAVLFLIYTKTSNELIKKLIRAFMCFALVWTIFISGVQSVGHMFRYDDIYRDYPEIAYDTEQFFAFWK